MNILYVLHQFFPLHHTGTERLTLQIAKQIQKMGHFVYILTSEPNNQNIEGFEIIDDLLLAKKYQVESIPVISLKKIEQTTNIEIYDLELEKYVRKIIEKFDVVHFTHPWRFGIVQKICKDLGIPTVLTLTDTWLLCPRNLITVNSELCSGPQGGKKCVQVCRFEKNIIDRFQDAKSFFENIDKVFSGSEFIIKTFQENEIKKEITLNPFSIDFSNIEILDETNEIVFGYLGSLMKHKGLHILLEAFKKIKDQNIKLKIYGKGAEGDTYGEKMLSSIKDDKRIEYCGTFDYNELPNVMRGISVVVIPSMHKENFPLVMQLAMGYRKPVIGTKIGGIPEVITDGENGLLFEYGDVEQLSEIISKISQNPKILSELKQNIKAPNRIEEEAFMYEEAYRSLLQEKSSN